MAKMHELMKKRSFLRSLMKSMDKDAPLHTEEGKTYCQILVRTALIQLDIDSLQKEKAAR
ncbi:hypothetical protein [Paenibacillus thalictri]|uniref:Uncharacterized protein n=1 Tax=Paenibacillus thalictri TaxID=2527873 RepID=A0A4Q9DE52_9BACL|nr:hypothetical protein [Paenibacillus thalictri]TBL69787.1 hypothetical protein EYB31_35010 [Paenibacillus thalictri]